MTESCAEARAELLAAQLAYDESLRSKGQLRSDERVPATDLNEFEKAFMRRQAAEQRVKELCSDELRPEVSDPVGAAPPDRIAE